MKRIYRVSMTLTAKGWTIRETPFDVIKETPKTFQLEDMSNDFRDKRNLKKEKLGVVATNLLSKHDYYQYYCWCKEEDIAYSKERVKGTIISKFQQVWREVNLISKQFADEF